MASDQCRKPSNETTQQIQSTYHQKTTTTEVPHNKNHSSNEHSFTDKVKEMAHSARKMFNHHDHQGHPVPNHTQKPTSNCATGTAHEKTEKKKKMVKNTEGHCMPRMLDHMKRKKKKSKAGKHSGNSSDSGSSSD